jgi:hypothetical protein
MFPTLEQLLDAEQALKNTIKLNCIYSFSPYRAVNTLRLDYKKPVS